MFNQHERTNNNVEGTHNNLKAVAGPSSISLVTFILKMKDEAEKIPMTAKLLSQEQALRRLNKNAESKQHHLTELWASYSRADNPISSKELLEALGNLTHKFSRAQLRELRNANGLDESD
ncbi:hypothetical protein DAPPUDRAFT_318686 [Daphnia pulex]|nr:hypothetical protein DAPPUDRAFT_337035 [Daphnia pulex]EFX80475.1 hypothetical protein DAPPUDRAFT_318686 [Daphnia pulex]|eukprot:EFX62385.1 hypothetical protein DAPPUDRAFT_337035 [Daphnia pulex]